MGAEVTTTVKPAEPGVQPVAWRFHLPPHEIGNTYVDGGERFVVSMVESLGYHDYGDPWCEQRYWGD